VLRRNAVFFANVTPDLIDFSSNKSGLTQLVEIVNFLLFNADHYRKSGFSCVVYSSCKSKSIERYFVNLLCEFRDLNQRRFKRV
jgi:hypothetical protein